MSETDKILQLRKVFTELSPHAQYMQWKWMERKIFNKRPIKVSPITDPTREKIFNEISEVIKYLSNQGYAKVYRSNIHKVLKGLRKTAYGHKIYYD